MKQNPMLTAEKRQELVGVAKNARKWAYAPYSNYHVGAALLTVSGRVYDGVNVENAAYPTTMCAERIAVFKAVSEGEKEFDAIAVVTKQGGMPCGSCRQVLSEFGLDTVIIVANEEGHIIQEVRLEKLLPHSFGPEDLIPDSDK
jgi:cytidine deaminase